MKQTLKQRQCTVNERNGQLVFALNNEILLPENAPVRLTSAQLEELDYRKLYRAYSAKGRKSKVDPRVLFKVTAYGYQCGIYSSRKLEEACRYRVDFMWLLEEEPVPDHTTLARFRTGRCAEAVEDLFYQYVAHLEQQGETDHGTVFVDGTKLESRAGRYTFCWRKSVEKHLKAVRQKVLDMTGRKSLLELKAYLEELEAGSSFVHGSGHRKSETQRQWEKLDELRCRWEEYEKSLEIMGPSRNSYSKTDPDATFMRMKEDHMRNGQLKPAYNVQIAVNSEYITGIETFSARTDLGTLVPFLEELKRQHKGKYAEVTADAGYESLENYLYLEKNGQMSFIKPSNYEVRKTKRLICNDFCQEAKYQQHGHSFCAERHSERASGSVTGIGHSDIRGLVTDRSMVRRERCRLKAWIAKHCADITFSQIARTVNVRSSFGMPFGISVRLLCSPWLSAITARWRGQGRSRVSGAKQP